MDPIEKIMRLAPVAVSEAERILPEHDRVLYGSGAAGVYPCETPERSHCPWSAAERPGF